MSTLAGLETSWLLVDNTGRQVLLGAEVCHLILGLGWAAYFLAWIFNTAFYCLHPSRGHETGTEFTKMMIFCSVDPFGLRRKMFVKILGHRLNLPTNSSEEEEMLIDETEETFPMNSV